MKPVRNRESRFSPNRLAGVRSAFGVRLAVGLVLLLVGTACGGDPEPAGTTAALVATTSAPATSAAPTTTVAETPTTTSAAPTTTSAEAVTTTTVAEEPVTTEDDMPASGGLFPVTIEHKIRRDRCRVAAGTGDHRGIQRAGSGAGLGSNSSGDPGVVRWTSPRGVALGPG